MKLKYQFVINPMMDEFIAVPMGSEIVDFNGVIRLNETSAFIFEQLNAEITYEVLINSVADKFDCESNYAKENVDAIINELRENGLIME